MSEAHCNNLPQRKALGLVTHDNTGGPFVVECQGCGAVYPSFHCLGGGQIADTGDYEDARCPHCQQVDPEECDNAALAWNTQQLKINALQEMLNQREEQLTSLEQRRYAEQQAREAVEKNADRYRWLRARDLETIQQGGVFAGVTPENMVINGVDLDDAIDAAIEAALSLASDAESQSAAPGYAPSPQQ